MSKTEIPNIVRYTLEIDVEPQAVKWFNINEVLAHIYHRYSTKAYTTRARIIKAPPEKLLRQIEKEGS